VASGSGPVRWTSIQPVAHAGRPRETTARVWATATMW